MENNIFISEHDEILGDVFVVGCVHEDTEECCAVCGGILVHR
jgi:hypothetical protein